MTAIRTFGRDLVTWLSDALKTHPKQLHYKKLQVAHCFSQHLWRQTAVSEMASIARSFLHSRDISTKLLQDWMTLDTDIITKEVSHDLELSPEASSDLQHYVEEFEQLLNQHVTLDQYIDWVKIVFSQTIRRTLECSTSSESSLRVTVRTILLQWVYITKIFIRELTLLSADMFGPYHLMSLLSQDYVMYLTENWKRKETQHRLKSSIYGGEETDFVPDWDTLLSASPNKVHSSSNASSMDSYRLTAENYTSGGQRQKRGYHHDLSESLPPQSSGAQKREANYVSLVGLQKAERCELLHFHDDMRHQNRAFDEVDQTPPDDHGPRALDLSNYNSSFTDDDALVDKVISKGYATLDDCSQTISPLPWKSEGSHRSVTSSSGAHHHGETSWLNSRAVTQATSTITSSATYHQLVTQQPILSSPHAVMSAQMVAAESDMQSTEPYSGSSNANYKDILQAMQNQTPSPAVFNSKSSSYSTYPSPGYLGDGMITQHQGMHQHNQEQASSPSPVSYPKCERQSVTVGYNSHSFTLPEFTHISGSLQFAPLNPRKKWILEEAVRSGLVPTRLTHVPHTWR